MNRNIIKRKVLKRIKIGIMLLLVAVFLIVVLTVCRSNNFLVETPEEPQSEVVEEQTEYVGAEPESIESESEEITEPENPENEMQAEEIQAEEQTTVENTEPENEEATEPDSVTLSILGDSISTFDGWIPEGYQDFFPMNGEVTDVNQTWWKMVLEDTGMALCVNGSSSGSTCAGDSLSTDNPMYGCSDYRIKGLAGAGGKAPDVIIVYMGTNDLVTSIPLGNNDGTRAVAEGTIENFSDAYCLILDKLAANYPEAKIFCCTIAPVGDWGTEQPFVTFVNGQGLTYVEYCETIKTIAGAKGYPVIDLQNCGIMIDNMQQFITDGVHLKPEGMLLVKEAVLKVIGK